MFELGDRVQVVDSGTDVWTIVKKRDGEPCYAIQFGGEAATEQLKRTDELVLVSKAKKPAVEPRLAPDRGIMD